MELDLGSLIAHLRLDNSQWTTPIQQAQKQMENMGESTAKSLRGVEGSINKMSSAFRTVAQLAAAYLGANVFRSFISSAMEAERAQMALVNALKATGTYSKESISGLQSFADEVASVTLYTKEDILQQMAHAKILGIEADQLELVTSAAVGLSSAYNIDLSTAMHRISMAYQGSTYGLSRMGIILDENMTKQEKLHRLLEIGVSKFDLAAAQTKTTVGAVAQLSKAWSEVKEKLGTAFLPVVQSVSEALRGFLSSKDFIPKIQFAAEAFRTLAIAVAGLYIFKTIGGLASFTLSALSGVVAVAASLAAIDLTTGLAAGLSAVSAALRITVAPALLLISAIVGIAVGLYSLRTAWIQNFGGMRDITVEFANNIKSSFQWLWNAVLHPFLDGLIRDFKLVFGFLKDILVYFVNSVKEGFQWLWNTVLRSFLRLIVDEFVAAFKSLRIAMVEFIGDIAGTVKGAVVWIREMKDGIVSAWSSSSLTGAIDTFKRSIKSANELWASSFVEGKEGANKSMVEFKEFAVANLDILSTSFKEFGGWVSDTWEVLNVVGLKGFGVLLGESLGDLWKANLSQIKTDMNGVENWINTNFPLLGKLLGPIKIEYEVPNIEGGVDDSSIKALQDRIKGMIGAADIINRDSNSILRARASLYGQLNRMSYESYLVQKELLDLEAAKYLDEAQDAVLVAKWKKEQLEKLEIAYLKSAGGVSGGFQAYRMEAERTFRTAGEAAYEFSESMEDSIGSALEGMSKDFSNWGSQLKALLKEIYFEAIRIAFIQPAANALARGLTNIGSSLFNSFGSGTSTPIVKHAGGMGRDNGPFGFWSPQFLTAPRFHSGRGDVAAWIQENEHVLTAKQMDYLVGMAGRGSGEVTINFNNQSGVLLDATQSTSYKDSDQRIIDVTIQAASIHGTYRRLHGLGR